MDSGEVLFSPSSVSANQVFVVIKCFSMLVDSRYHVVNSAFYCGVQVVSSKASQVLMQNSADHITRDTHSQL